MAPDLATALDGAGIALRRCTAGTHRAPCPGCGRGPRDDTLGVTLDADGGAVWHCFRCDLRGGWRPRGAMPARAARAVCVPPKAKHGSGLSDTGRRIWAQARPITPGDIAGRYLTGRCCAIPENDVRFHPAAWHPQERRTFPAMAALITDIITGEPISLHMTYLAHDGSGKAPIDRPRLYLAGHRKAGGVVRLYADAEVTQGLILGEGIETCLTAALEFSPVWACLDAGNLAAFPVLPGIEGLTVLVDNDAAGIAALKAVRDRYAEAGIEMIEIKAADAGADLNDMVTA